MIHPTPVAGTWAVIELAGYVGERMGSMGFTTYSDANQFALDEYEEEEREKLHVDIAYWHDDGFWSYDY